MSTVTGKLAEDAAATHLRGKGFIILAQNWRTRWCEIDIVASKADVIYFVEVKYRSNDAWGAGFEYVTSKKLQQMDFAARLWVADSKGIADYHLAALELTDNPPRVSNWVDEIY